MFEVNISSSELAASAALSWTKSQLVFEVNTSSSELAASAAYSWMKSQLMFEVNISSSELEAKCLMLDEVPTHVRSERQLEVSLQQVLHSSWKKSQLMFEVNITQVNVQPLAQRVG